VTAAPPLPGWRHAYSGKVRDLYVPDGPGTDGPPDEVLVVASDRISAFDHVLPTPVPDKGAVLTSLSLWWFERLREADVGVRDHVLHTDVPAAVRGRAMVCVRLVMLPFECVARGYLTGSGLAEYQATGSVCGVPLPAGLRDGDRLERPIFTPATKAALGEHDENITFEHLVGQVGAELAGRLRDLTLGVYAVAERAARERGVLLADTKLEFGTHPTTGELRLGDEVLTPDSSRFWPAEDWSPGRPQPSFDKQFVRDWLTGDASGWDRAGDAPPPALPAQVVERTRDRYLEAYRRLTGTAWAPGAFSTVGRT
jgi:phosphoribosylaminoimidazole-succinocarboxamide synthase